jgi:NADH dehydrogenase [ubiquinone] 1 alpha subcomplex assembly factor 6
MTRSLLSYCADLLRRHDNDRYLTALFAPAERREALLALYAFNLELARARESVREPIMGQMRLQWWRDCLRELRTGRLRSHEVVRPLAQAIAAGRLDPALLERLIDARERDMEPDPLPDLPALLAYAEATSATLVEGALGVLGAPTAAAREAGHAVGLAWALIGLIRAVPFHAAQRRLYLPASLIAEAGLDPDALFERGGSPALRQVARQLADEARYWLALAAARRPEVPRQFHPALLPASLARGHLRRLAAAGYDPFDARVQQAPPGRVWSLALSRALGRF